MNNVVDKDKWMPVAGMILEESALEAVKSERNMLVIAGPGAGKSELLAQRACYLLQTNECNNSRRILAVSFKKDAAANIKERVLKRCGKELGERFDSMTFDAFAKSLVDQFLNAIPNEYRPTREYELINDNELIDLLKENEIFSYKYKNQYMNEINKLTEDRLPFLEEKNEIGNLWKYIANTSKYEKCYLTFRMINRLAEYLIRSNPILKKILNMAYSHIFLDEYQDTTLIQYDLLTTCFYEEDTVITAVGDDKQRIMVWAGALKDAFNRLVRDFNAKETMLVMNHRSAPRLLNIQKTLYKEFFYKNSEVTVDIVNNKKWDKDDGKSYLHLFSDDISEAKRIAYEINELIRNGHTNKEICILVKQQPDKYCKYLIECLAKYSIIARNEIIYQDLLKEDLINLLNDVMTIIIKDKAPTEWGRFTQLMLDLNQDILKDIYKIDQLEKTISTQVLSLKRNIMQVSGLESFKKFIYRILEFINIDKIKGKYNQYKNDNTFTYFIDTYYKLLWKEFEGCGKWQLAIENFKGENSIPIMTIHKSKGLEYDIVFFIGLEDGAFWNFDNQRNEEFCAFFVALSRAKKRVDFTYSASRSFTRYPEQYINKISEFYSILKESEVVEVRDNRK